MKSKSASHPHYKFSLNELDEIVNSDCSRVCIKNCARKIPVHPSCLSDLKSSVKTLFDSYVNKFDKTFDGFVLGCKNIKILSDKGSIINDDCYVHFDIEADFYIFQPKVDTVVIGKVKKKKHDQLICLVHKCFNVSISRPIEENDWLGDYVEVGDSAVIQLEECNFDSSIPYMRGKLVGTRPKISSSMGEAKEEEEEESESVPKKKKKKKDKHSKHENIEDVESDKAELIYKRKRNESESGEVKKKKKKEKRENFEDERPEVAEEMSFVNMTNEDEDDILEDLKRSYLDDKPKKHKKKHKLDLEPESTYDIQQDENKEKTGKKLKKKNKGSELQTVQEIYNLGIELESPKVKRRKKNDEGEIKMPLSYKWNVLSSPVRSEKYKDVARNSLTKTETEEREKSEEEKMKRKKKRKRDLLENEVVDNEDRPLRETNQSDENSDSITGSAESIKTFSSLEVLNKFKKSLKEVTSENPKKRSKSSEKQKVLTDKSDLKLSAKSETKSHKKNENLSEEESLTDKESALETEAVKVENVEKENPKRNKRKRKHDSPNVDAMEKENQPKDIVSKPSSIAIHKETEAKNDNPMIGFKVDASALLSDFITKRGRKDAKINVKENKTNHVSAADGPSSETPKKETKSSVVNPHKNGEQKSDSKEMKENKNLKKNKDKQNKKEKSDKTKKNNKKSKKDDLLGKLLAKVKKETKEDDDDGPTPWQQPFPNKAEPQKSIFSPESKSTNKSREPDPSQEDLEKNSQKSLNKSTIISPPQICKGGILKRGTDGILSQTPKKRKSVSIMETVSLASQDMLSSPVVTSTPINIASSKDGKKKPFKKQEAISPITTLTQQSDSSDSDHGGSTIPKSKQPSRKCKEKHSPNKALPQQSDTSSSDHDGSTSPMSPKSKQLAEKSKEKLVSPKKLGVLFSERVKEFSSPKKSTDVAVKEKELKAKKSKKDKETKQSKKKDTENIHKKESDGGDKKIVVNEKEKKDVKSNLEDLKSLTAKLFHDFIKQKE